MGWMEGMLHVSLSEDFAKRVGILYLSKGTSVSFSLQEAKKVA